MKDSYEIQEPTISLFRWVVPLFYRRTPDTESYNSVLESNDQIYIRSNELTSAVSILYIKNKTVSFVRAGYALRPKFYLSLRARIDCPNDIQKKMYSKESNRGIEYTKWTDLLRKLSSKKNEKTHKFERIFQLISDPTNLCKAWDQIKNKSMHLTKIKNPKSLQKTWIIEVSKKLRLGTYKYTVAKRVEISKKKKSGHYQPLIITSSQDKMVQQAFFQILQLIWEGNNFWKDSEMSNFLTTAQKYISNVKKKKMTYPIENLNTTPVFFNSNQGYRPTKGVHSALNEVKTFWKNVNWFLTFDIKKTFNKINHQILIKELKNKINDQKTIDEIYKMLNVKILNFEIKNKQVNTPQGSVLSPFLFNVYMHRLDEFLEKIKTKHNTIALKKENPEYSSKKHDLMNTAKHKKWNLNKRLRFHKQLKKQFKKSGVDTHIHLKKQIHLYYIRYANEFLIGVQGDKVLAKKVSKQIKDFIKSALHFIISEAHIKHCKSDKTKFLGFLLSQSIIKSHTKGKTLERFKRLKTRYKTLRKAEYIQYLRMLREGEKRFWMQFLEKSARKTNQTMVSKLHLLKTIEVVTERKIIEQLELQIKKTKKQIINNNKQEKTRQKKPQNNPRLVEAKQETLKRWKLLIKNWINKAKTISRIVPEDEAELMELIGEEKLKKLITARETYYTLLDEWDSRETKKEITKALYKKHKETILKQKNNNNGKAHIKKKFNTNLSKRNIFIEMPYTQIKEKLKTRGYITQDKPCSNPILINLADVDIIQHYTYIAQEIINFYICADNKWDLVKLINWHLRYSLLHTLAHKHSTTIHSTIKRYTITPSVWVQDSKGNTKLMASFINPLKITTMKKQFFFTNKNLSPKRLETVLGLKSKN